LLVRIAGGAAHEAPLSLDGVRSYGEALKKKTSLLSAGNEKKRAAKLKRPNHGAGVGPARKLKQARSFEPALFPAVMEPQASSEVLNRLWVLIESRKNADPAVSHSARLLARGTARVAQKLGEEAVECLIEAITGNRVGLIGESADVLYHLLVTWVGAGIRPEEVWQELQQREQVSHLTEGEDIPLKRLLGSVQIGTSKIP
jgi:phosphoribosyl-ATP pyrophosphohydrolase